MLSADLVRATCRAGQLKVTPLAGKQRVRAAELAAEYLAITGAHVGAAQHELKEALAAVEVASREAKLAAGLLKLIEDACEFDAESPVEPRKLRSDVFSLAATARKTLQDEHRFDRRALLEEAGRAHGLDPEQLEHALYSDLKSEHRLLKPAAISPTALLERYDLAQLQAVLLKAVKITATITCATPAGYRDIFRKLKFRRLLFQVRQESDGSYRLEIDGPYSLFESVTKYGLSLAMMLPSLLSAERVTLKADLRWGKAKAPATFTFEHRGAVADDAGSHLPEEVAALLETFQTARDGWTAKLADRVIDLPGIGLCVPDLHFSHRSGARAYLEVLGYWSRDALWRRIEMVQKGIGEKILFAASERLRVSEEVLADHPSGALYVYKSSLSAKAVAERLERLRGAH